jgi:hypothetical protein
MEVVSLNKVKDALGAWLGPEGMVDLEKAGKSGRITGWIMHPAFRGIPRAERQKWLWTGFEQVGTLPEWNGLRNLFGEGSAQIGVILTYSPEEYENALGLAQSA